MDQYEENYEEVSDHEEEVPDVQLVAVAVVAVAPLNVEVPENPEKPESPPPSPSSPSPELPSLRASPVEDLPSFMGFYTADDLIELVRWAVDSRATRSQPEFRVEKHQVSRYSKVFLRVMP